MKLIKSVFLTGLFLVIAAAGAFTMYNRGAFNELEIEKILPQIASFIPSQTQSESQNNTAQSTKQSTQISFDQQVAEQQIQILSERSQEVSAEVGKVLGDFVKVNENAENNQALHERALEYGQYLYCQQVVLDYEKKEKAQDTYSNKQ